jgi:hypothetical protein
LFCLFIFLGAAGDNIGVGGYQERDIQCVDRFNVTQPENTCPSPRPKQFQSCNSLLCDRQWKASEWSMCPKDCDGGAWTNQTRTFTCINEKVGGPAPLSDCDYIKNQQPTTTQLCGQMDCADYERAAYWKVSDWSSCAAGESCTAGTQYRNVSCVNSIGRNVSWTLCEEYGNI